jgi:hypothetical protein
MAIAGSRIWYHPRWFARHVPDPDIEGRHLDDLIQPAGTTEERASVTVPGRPDADRPGGSR